MSDCQHCGWDFVIEAALAHAAKTGNEKWFGELLDGLLAEESEIWDTAAEQIEGLYFTEPLTAEVRQRMDQVARGPSSLLRKGKFAKMDWVQQALG